MDSSAPCGPRKYRGLYSNARVTIVTLGSLIVTLAEAARDDLAKISAHAINIPPAYMLPCSLSDIAPLAITEYQESTGGITPRNDAGVDIAVLVATLVGGVQRPRRLGRKVGG